MRTQDVRGVGPPGKIAGPPLSANSQKSTQLNPSTIPVRPERVQRLAQLSIGLLRIVLAVALLAGGAILARALVVADHPGLAVVAILLVAWLAMRVLPVVKP